MAPGTEDEKNAAKRRASKTDNGAVALEKALKKDDDAAKAKIANSRNALKERAKLFEQSN